MILGADKNYLSKLYKTTLKISENNFIPMGRFHLRKHITEVEHDVYSVENKSELMKIVYVVYAC